MTEADTSGIIARITGILLRELQGLMPSIKADGYGLRCSIPRAKGILIINVSSNRISWESIPRFLQESISISTDAEWELAVGLLETQLRDWRKTLE